jgi:hypothetical protein
LSSPARVWTALAVLYALFFGWYTSFGGPLRPDEIDRYMIVLEEAGGEPERLALWRAFMESDTGDDFAMLNNLDLWDEVQPTEGVPDGLTPSEVMGLYTRPFLGQALLSAAHPVLMGTAAAPALDTWGIAGADVWDSGGLVRYRSRRDLMEQAVFVRSLETNIHDYKIAALEKTVAYPLDPWFQLGDPRLVLALAFLVLGLAWQLRCARISLRSGG